MWGKEDDIKRSESSWWAPTPLSFPLDKKLVKNFERLVKGQK